MVRVVRAVDMNVWSFEDLDVVTEVDVIDQAAFNMSWLLYQLIKV